MQTIPELGVPPQPEAPPSDDTTDPTPCHLELVSELESSPLKPVASSTSMDSLSDVDFGMEEQAGVTEETDGRRVRKPEIWKVHASSQLFLFPSFMWKLSGQGYFYTTSDIPSLIKESCVNPSFY